MKKIIILSLLVFLTSCGRPLKVRVCNGIIDETWVYCDSFQMISEKEADITIDGKVMKIKASKGIYPESTGLFGW